MFPFGTRARHMSRKLSALVSDEDDEDEDECALDERCDVDGGTRFH